MVTSELIREICAKLQNKNIFRIENYFLNDPELQTSVDTSYLSHKEKYEEAVRRVTIILKKIEKLKSEGRGMNDLYR